MMEQMKTVEQIAKHYQVTPRLIRDITDAGILPCVRLGPRVTRYCLSDCINSLNGYGGRVPQLEDLEEEPADEELVEEIA